MAEEFDPYHKWLGIPPKDQPPNHYRLLGIEKFEDDRDTIDAAANRMMLYLKQLAGGDDAAYSQQLLNEVAQARLCLLNPQKKAAYDTNLRRNEWQRLGYTREQIEQLLTGRNWLERGFGTHENCDVEAMRRAWKELRNELLPDWIAGHPGTRPYAWWRFDAPEPRQRIDGKPHPFDDPHRDFEVDRLAPSPDSRARYYELGFGIPRLRLGSIPDELNAEYESPPAYLNRLGLLPDDEKSLIRDTA